MCTGCVIDHINVCPSCKRDDEAYKLGEAESPFRGLGDARLHCVCGNIFIDIEEEEKRRSGYVAGV
ncbi:MAG: hypothetical protein M0024_00365 [Nitrospiraceae bacterium]|nr:hypothetical protein [Nitrospiraceae bacterium]